MKLFTDRNGQAYVFVKTANMGSCQCGDCYCSVFPDGTIQYDGKYAWQCSGRLLGSDADKPRHYHSQLGADAYNVAMKMLHP